MMGAGALLRPVLAQAQTGVSPQRLLIIHRPCGSAMNPIDQPGAPSWWWPTSGTPGGTDWVVAPGGLIDSFSRVRQKMVVLKGIHCPRVQAWLGDKHGAGMLAMISPSPADPGPSLAAWPVLPGRTAAEQMDTNAKFFTSTDRSIDQLFLNAIPTLGTARLASLTLTPDLVSAQQQDNCVRVVSYAKDSLDPAVQPTPLWPEADPSTTFANIFGGVVAGIDPTALARARAQNKSVIDFILRDLNSLRPRLPALAAQKLDSHLSSVRRLETALNARGAGQACTPSGAPEAAPADNDARYDLVVREGMDLIKTAFQCDLTRVITYTFGWGNCGVHFSNVLAGVPGAIGITDTESYHNISHNGGGDTHDQAQFAIDRYFCTTVANLLSDMDDIQDGPDGSTLLDNTLVVFWNECSVGNVHDTQNMPVLLFGAKFLNLQGGRYFDFSAPNNGSDRFMSDLWVQVSKAWSTAPGVTGYSPLSSYGAAQWNTGSLSGVFA
jgi:hypothetical protein